MYAIRSYYAATIIVDAFKKMENDAWHLASQVLTPQQLEELKDLILDWNAANPRQHAVDYIRFSDFGDLGNVITSYSIHYTKLYDVPRM